VDGSCTSDLPLGSDCGTNPKACASGYCVDGVCCDTSACATCHTCNGSPKGTCTALDGVPCGAATCTDGTKENKTCQAGSCETVAESCGDYACNSAGTDCLQACSDASGCSSAAYCELTVCKPKKPNGVSCVDAQECVGGFCTASEKVCCDSACAGECETCAGKASCSPKGAGTPCGNQQLTCVDTATTSSISQPQCNGAKSCVPTVVQSCEPYRCRPGPPPTCPSSCSAQSECTTLCDVFGSDDPLQVCRPASEVCFADTQTCPSVGAGTQSSPFCKIQSCLDTLKPWVAVADGDYPENLITKGNAVLASTGTTGPLVVSGAFQTKATLTPHASSTVGITAESGHRLEVFGFDIAPASSASGALVEAKPGAEVVLHTSHVHGAQSAACLVAVYAFVGLSDVIVEDCEGHAVTTEVTEAKFYDVQLRSSGGRGLNFSDGDLTLRDVAITANAGFGMQVYGGFLDLDRVRIAQNGNDGMRLESDTTGWVKNLAVYQNSGKGIYFYGNTTPPRFINVTVAHNLGLEVEGDPYVHSPPVYTEFYNSILWHQNSTWKAQSELKLYHSNVSHTVSGCPPSCTGTFSDNPLFAGGAEPFALSASSPCVDAGDDSVSGLSGRDLLKMPRQIDKVPGGAMVDMGAFEVQP
jgi:hypothetical protein